MYWPEESKLPLLPLIILPLLPMLASLEVFKVPVSVRSIAISLKLRAAWILDWWESNGEGLVKPILNSNVQLSAFAVCHLWGSDWPCSAYGPGRTDVGWWPWPRWTWWGQDRRTTCAQRCHCDQMSFLSPTPYSKSGHKASLYTLNTKHWYVFTRVKVLQTHIQRPSLPQKY